MRPSCNAEHVMYILWQMPQISKLEYLGGQRNSKRCCYISSRCLAKKPKQATSQNGLNYFPYCPIYALLSKWIPFKPTLLPLHQLPLSFRHYIHSILTIFNALSCIKKEIRIYVCTKFVWHKVNLWDMKGRREETLAINEMESLLRLELTCIGSPQFGKPPPIRWTSTNYQHCDRLVKHQST